MIKVGLFIRNSFNKNLWLTILSILLLIPYVVISFYNHPSVDDYSFTYKVETFGFWGAQYDWFTTWTGRYFSTLILSFHPLWLKASFIYKVIPVLLIGITVHVLVRFLRQVLKINDSGYAYTYAVLIAFLFFSEMPTLVQGIYWEPGAITYHLANVFLLYLFINLYKVVTTNGQILLKQHAINMFLIIAICGLNETSMLLCVLLLFSFLGYVVSFQKQLNPTLVIYLLLSTTCFLVVFFAPGNLVRSREFVTGNHNLLFTIVESFKVSSKSFFYWGFSVPNIILSFSVAVFSFFYNIKVSIKAILFCAIIGFLFVTATFVTGFWSIGNLPPERTINVAYWNFVILWIASVFIMISWIKSRFYSSIILSKRKFNALVFLTIFSLLVSSFFGASNYAMVIDDLFSGKAKTYSNEFVEREKTLFTCKEDICSIPTFSAYPASIFNEEIGTGTKYNNNEVYAHYYDKKGVLLGFSPPKFSDTYFFNLEDDNNALLENLYTLAPENSSSPPNSSLITSESSYSVLFRKKNKDLKTKNISKIYVKADVLASDSIVDFAIVLSATDKNNNSIYWFGREIIQQNYSVNKWVKEENIFSLNQITLNPENQYQIYIWNRGQDKVYIDDLVISFF